MSQHKFQDIQHTDRAGLAVSDIQDPGFWNQIYLLTRAVFPCLKALRFCDKSEPSMDKIIYLVHRAEESIKNSLEVLNDLDVFPFLCDDAGLQFEKVQMFDSSLSGGNGNSGEVYQDEEEKNDESDDDSAAADDEDQDMEATGLGDKILARWNVRKASLIHDVSITAWALAISPEIREDVKKRLSGDDRNAIEQYITSLFANDSDCDVPTKIDTFWNEFNHWQKKTGPFANAARFQTPDALAGRSASWHNKYSKPFTEVLGIAACRSTSNWGGMGAAEKSWGHVKDLKSGQRSLLSGEKVEMQGVLYSSARIEEARTKRAAMEKIDAVGSDAMFGDDDINFDLQLESFGVDVQEVGQTVPRRLFHAWIEDWEEPLLKKNDPVAEARLKVKYQNLVFYDPDNKAMYTIFDGNLEYRKGRKGGWCVIGVCSDDDFEDEPFMIGDMLIEMIVGTEQDAAVIMIMKDDEGVEDI